MAVAAYNTRFLLPASGAGVLLGEHQSISFSGVQGAEIDITALISATKAYILGTIEGGTVEVVSHVAAGTVPNQPVTGSSTPYTYKIIFGNADGGNDGVTVTFDAYLVNTKFEASVDQAVGVTYTLRITGAVTVAYQNT
jgi:hypothetical protein